MSAARIVEVLGEGAPFVLLGALLGIGYFGALRSNVERYLFGRSIKAAVALHCGRLLFAGVAFVLIAQAGAAALLGALGGFLLARTLALCSGNRRP
jgi:F1F0 ATPase subunit 2